jgi:hypothetical protein
MKFLSGLRKHPCFLIVIPLPLKVHADLGDRRKKIIVYDGGAVLPDRKHPGLHADCMQVGAILALCEGSDFREPDRIVHRERPCVDF